MSFLNRLPCFHSPIYFCRHSTFTLFHEVGYFFYPFSLIYYQVIFLIRIFRLILLLIREGHLWDFCLSHSSVIVYKFPPLLQLLPMHLTFFESFKVRLAHFFAWKAHCFWLGITCSFSATRGQRLPGATGVWTLDPPGFEPLTLRFSAWCHVKQVQSTFTQFISH